MKKNRYFILCFMALMASVLLSSCSADGDETATAGKRLNLNVDVKGFSEAVSRSGGVFTDGDVVYISIEGENVSATLRNSQWTFNDVPSSLRDGATGSCYVYFLDEQLSTQTAKVVYGTSAGSYVNATDVLSIKATLSPVTSRVRFRGEAGTQISVYGPRCITAFSTDDFSRTYQTSVINLTVGSSGYTPYIYCVAQSSGKIQITNGGSTYTRTFGSNVLQVGHSGYIDIPTPASYAGWTTDEKMDVDISGSGYGSDEDWNQSDPEPDTNVDIGGSGYGGDEDWTPTSTDSHEAVDLGLSVKWATCNVGAEKPEDYGLYFAWGETKGYTSDTSDGRSFDWASYKWCNGSSTTMTKYCISSSDGTVDYKTTLESADDAATANWGGSWRMPTEAEQYELRNNCTWTWTTRNGVNGCEVKSKRNSNSIFLPAAGYRSGTNLSSADSYGVYWSSSLYGSSCAWGMDSYSDYVGRGSYGDRRYGFSVRPVCP